MVGAFFIILLKSLVIIGLYAHFGPKGTPSTINALAKLAFTTSVGNLPDASTLCLNRFYSFPVDKPMKVHCESGTITNLNNYGFILPSFKYLGD